MTARRHTSQRRSVSWSRWLRHLGRGRWLTQLSVVDQTLGRLQRILARLLFPKWIRHAAWAVRTTVQRAEKRVSKTGRKVSKSVAGSAVGEGAKQLARQSRLLESKATQLLLSGLVTLMTALIPAPLQRLVRSLGKATWRVLRMLIVFLGGWFSTRRYWHLVGGAPAFLMALPLAYCMVRLPFYGEEAKAKRYRVAASEALQREDYRTADLYYRKLFQLNAMSQRLEFQAAYNAFASGQEAEALKTFHRLAPDDQPGFGPAHLWLAQWYLNNESGLDSDQASKIAERHLQFALDRDPGNPQARALRALNFQRSGRWNEALDELRQVAKDLPQVGLNLARIYARQGRWQAARDEVNKVVKIYEGKRQQADELTAVEYQIWSEAYLIIGDAARAEEVLDEGLKQHPNDDPMRDRLYELSMTRVNSLADQPNAFQEQLMLLQRSWRLKPSETDPLILIGQLALADGPAGEAAQATVRELMSSASPPLMLNAILGTAAAEKGRYQQAADYLEQACQATPDDAQVLNNLAWVLLQLKSELPRALTLANRAVELEPDVSFYRETRGQLLVLAQRYTEAIDDLTQALNGLGDDAAIHAALAEAYQQLGQDDLAKAHRQQAR
jgi:tetratricopeptide (TPR) repeat protein